MSRIISETPERWCIVKITAEGRGDTYKVYGTWAGGYLDGDRWKLNSGISKVEEDDDNYYFYGHSGSCYKCHKKGYGVATSYGQGVLSGIIDKAEVVSAKVEVIDENTDWINLNY